jgi:hypothetical protein
MVWLEAKWIEIPTAFTSELLLPRWKILDGESSRVKFHRNIIILSKLANRK